MLLRKERSFDFTREGLEDCLSYKGEIGYKIKKLKRDFYAHVKRNRTLYMHLCLISIEALMLVLIVLLTTNFGYTVDPLAPVMDNIHSFKLLQYLR